MEEQNDFPVIREAVVMRDKVSTYDFLAWCQNCPPAFRYSWYESWIYQTTCKIYFSKI